MNTDIANAPLKLSSCRRKNVWTSGSGLTSTPVPSPMPAGGAGPVPAALGGADTAQLAPSPTSAS